MPASALSLEKLEKICSKNPTSILFARLAEGFLVQGQVKRATEICRQGLRYRPSYVAGHVVMGKCHLANGLVEEARQEFQKVLQLDADHPAALWHLGQIDLQLGWEDLALRHFELALILDPFNTALTDQIAKLKPRSDVKESEDGNPDDVDVSLPEVEETADDEGTENLDFEAEDDAPIALAVDDNLSELVSEIAQGPPVTPEAAEETDAEEDKGRVAIATITLAELYAEQGLVEQAVITLEHVLKRDPNNATVLARLEALRS